MLIVSVAAQIPPLGRDPSPMDFQEALSKISKIKDEVSIKLNDTNFEHLTQAATGATTGDWFVYFYLPDCQKCTLYSPQWKFFAEAAKAKDLQVNVAKVNIEESHNLARRFNISRFPTLLYFSSGVYYNYTGPSDEEALVEAVETLSVKNYKSRRVPEEMTPFKEWVMYLKWWGVNGPKLYPYETAGAALGALLILVILGKVCCRSKPKERKAEAKAEENKTSSSKKTD